MPTDVEQSNPNTIISRSLISLPCLLNISPSRKLQAKLHPQNSSTLLAQSDKPTLFPLARTDITNITLLARSSSTYNSTI